MTARVILPLLLSICECQASPELNLLEGKIRAELRDTEWRIERDWRSITLTRKNVQFLNPRSTVQALLNISEDDWWHQHASISDYRITITLDTRLSQAEYDDLLRIQRRLTEKRIADVAVGTKEFHSISTEAQGIIRLPNYYLERFSVFVYTSDGNLFHIRPDSVQADQDKILKILETTCRRYQTKGEQ